MNGDELPIGVDEVLVFGVGVLFDLFVEFADVGGGNGGVGIALVCIFWYLALSGP
ncbi:hypothetical protein BHECKSOX2_1563 [Bathymodiolus heckerae thiotrophic gill symbiont]|nr:hypothetical protein BHECKSOX2_1563 [Bathymodiolus heckerae thiotrophic gill symbiont]